jgi:subfamily B ATP-binding cassette protein MsbA
MPQAQHHSPPDSLVGVYLRLLGYLKPLILPFLASIAGFMVYAASNPMLADLNGLVIQAVQQKNPDAIWVFPLLKVTLKASDAQWALPVFAIAIFLIRGAGTFLGGYFNSFVAIRLINSMRSQVFRHLTRLPAAYFNAHSDGTITQRVTGSTGLMMLALNDSLKTLMREGLTVIFLLVYVFYLNWRLSLIFLTVAPLMLILVRYTSSRFRTLTRKNENTNATIMQNIYEMISGQQVMRIFNAQPFVQARYQQALDTSLKQAMKMSRIGALSAPVMQLLVASALSGLIYLLLDPVVLAHNSPADLIKYITAVALLPKSMKQLGGLGSSIQRGLTGAQLIFELLDTPTETDNGTVEKERVAGKISVHNVSFRYSADRPLVLDNISFEIHPGEMVALVGKSGGGKTTLSALLARFYDVSSGSICIDDVDIRDYRLDNLRQHIGLVSQNVVLFNDTIRNNIAYGALDGASEAQVIDAARRAHALEFIQQMPKGFDTVIGSNGLQLSGGQRQRIAIARAFLKDAPILILDEATSALDNESEQKIQEALAEVMKGRTTIVIAHRLSTIENADTIFVMLHGTIAERGSHQELLKQGGIYQRLYTSKEF